MNDPARAFPFYLVNNFLLPVPVALLYYGLIRERTLFSRLLSFKILRLLGRTSYSFYLVHLMVIESIATPFILPSLRSHYNMYVILVFVLTQLIALLIFVFYEEPLNKYIRKKFKP